MATKQKSPFQRPAPAQAQAQRPTGRKTNIAALLGDQDESSSPGELGQAFRESLMASESTQAEPTELTSTDKQASEQPAAASEKPAAPTVPIKKTVPQQPAPADTAPSTIQPQGEDGVMLDLNQIVENPKLQPRLRINEDHVIALSDKFRRSGQLNAILVRPVDGRENLYEIIGGNHRYRAAQRLGWTQIRANIKRVTFNEARLMSVDDNDSLLPRTDYEKAISYQGLLDDGIAASHREIAEQLGVSKGRVTQCMAFLALPKQVLQILDDHPDLFSYRTALDLKKVMAKNGDADGNISERVSQAMADGVMRLVDDAPLSGLVHWIEQRISGKAPFTPSVEPRIVLDQSGRTRFKTRARENSIVIEWDKKATFTPDQIQDALMAVLKDLAQNEEQ